MDFDLLETVSGRTILLTLAFVAGATIILALLAGLMPVPLWFFGPFGGVVLYGVAALTVVLAFLIVWNWTGQG